MGTYTGASLAAILAKQLTDPGNILWTKNDYLYPAINEAQNTILFLRPDANSTTTEITLTPSPIQTLPVGGFRFLALNRNVGGKPIRKIDRKVISELIPDWTTETTTDDVLFVIFDDENPTRFSIYPTPGNDTMKAELVYAAKPTDVVSDSDTISLPDSYVAPIIEWTLYRCLSSPTAGINQAAAATHMNNFYQLVTGKNTVDAIIKQKTDA